MIENKKSKKANLENKRNLFFLIGLVLALASVLYAFEWKTNKSSVVEVFRGSDFVSDNDLFIPSTPAERMELPKPMVEVEFFAIVDDQTDVENIDVASSEPDDFPIVDFDDLIFHASVNKADEDEVILIPEIMPEFPGGQRALICYLANTIKYPLIAQENGIKGKVYVSFVIDEEGKVYNVNVVRGVDTSLDNEAVRVVEGMPRWEPGRQAGKAVKVRYNVPIYFELR